MPRKAPLAEVLAALPTCLGQPQSAGQLETLLAKQFVTDVRTIRKRLKELTDTGAYLTDPSGHLCAVVKQQQGRETWYSLRAVPVAA
jgi:hypothetical protein